MYLLLPSKSMNINLAARYLYFFTILVSFNNLNQSANATQNILKEYKNYMTSIAWAV